MIGTDRPYDVWTDGGGWVCPNRMQGIIVIIYLPLAENTQKRRFILCFEM